ncbi:MAG TPA: SCO family protein, partial [Balneolaceae bacterium]|nr:SCO family protein [Balneolaceae bacterium]
MKISALSAFATCMLAVLLISPPAKAQVNREKPDALQDLGITEKLGDHIPQDAKFVTSTGDTVMLGDLYEEGKPILLNPLYYECPMLCGLVLDGVFNVLEEVNWKPGK